jgi:CBS domain-containing protein
VSGVPVIDGGKLVGIVTEADLLVAEEEQLEPRGRGRSLEWFVHPKRLAAAQARGETSGPGT